MPELIHVAVATYRPSAAVVPMVASLAKRYDVTVADDASPSTSDAVLRELAALENVTVIRHRESCGIARSLNDGLRAAELCGAEWLLTLDQDSGVTIEYLNAALDTLASTADGGDAIGAFGAEIIADASGELRYPTRSHGGIATTDELVQSGTFWSVAALTRIGGFDERLGMDAVDAAACLRLREQGMKVAVIPGLRLEHAIGDARMVRIFGREVMVTGHSPERRTSMLRNRLRLFPAEFRQSPRHALRTIRRVTVNQGLGLVMESNRWSKAKGTIRGLGPAGDR